MQKIGFQSLLSLNQMFHERFFLVKMYLVQSDTFTTFILNDIIISSTKCRDAFASFILNQINQKPLFLCKASFHQAFIERNIANIGVLRQKVVFITYNPLQYNHKDFIDRVQINIIIWIKLFGTNII